MFELNMEELRKASGNHFQNLFTQLMKERYGDCFHSTSTYGREGDKHVDGVLNLNVAFAVYAPEVYKDDVAIKKIKKDFAGFCLDREDGYWCKIEKYVFVVKRERGGLTPKVLNLIAEFNEKFPVDIWTLDDLQQIAKGYLPFSSDGRLLVEFKADVIEIMEYIVDTDFAAEPFRMSLSDEIEMGILGKWRKYKYTFKMEEIEKLKSKILQTLQELCPYLSELYVHAIPGGRLLFNNNSWEAGERLRKDMQPQVFRIRCEVKKLLKELIAFDKL